MVGRGLTASALQSRNIAPATSRPWSVEREALKIGFEISAEAQSLVQFRQAVVPPPGAARSDTDIIFDLAGRLGLAEQFFGGSIEAAYHHQLQPSGTTVEQLRAEPRGIHVQLVTKHAKHSKPDAKGEPPMTDGDQSINKHASPMPGSPI